MSKVKIWTSLKKVLINIDKLTPEFLSNEYFVDTCKMAASLGEKVNCIWGVKRLKEEHDVWSRKITGIIASYEPLKVLKVGYIFKKFAEFSGYKMHVTNHELIGEGLMQDHCVGTYTSQVDGGHCAIYHVDGYTLQLTMNSAWREEEKTERLDKYGLERILYNSQFRGYKNQAAPKELVDKVESLIEAFNLNELKKVLEEEKNRKEDINEGKFMELDVAPNHNIGMF
jgi:hypothetical protein